MLNISGDNKQPCHKPVCTSNHSDSLLFTLIQHWEFVYKDLMAVNMCPVIPKL